MAYGTGESVAYQDDVPATLGRFDTRSNKSAAKDRTKNTPSIGQVIPMRYYKSYKSIITPTRAILFLFMAILFAAMVYSHMQITELNSEITAREAELEELKGMHVSLTTKREEIYSTEYIEAYAQEKLGMIKLDASQMEYVELSNPEKIEITGKGASVSGTVGTLVRGFTAVLEYLR